MFGGVLALRVHLLANPCAHLFYVGEISQLLRKLIVQLRQALLLNGLNLHGVGERLSGKPFVAVIIGIMNVEGTLITGGSTAQILGELRHRALSADLDQNVIHVYRLAFTGFGLSIQGDLGKVTLGQWAPFDRRKRRVLFAQISNCLLYFFIGDSDGGLVGANLLVAFDLDLGHDFEGGFESQRFAFAEM